MNEKNWERAFWIGIVVVYVAIGYWAYQVLVKPAAKATMQFLNVPYAAPQEIPSNLDL